MTNCPLLNAPFRGAKLKVRTVNEICNLQHDFMLNNLSLIEINFYDLPLCIDNNDG